MQGRGRGRGLFKNTSVSASIEVKPDSNGEPSLDQDFAPQSPSQKQANTPEGSPSKNPSDTPEKPVPPQTPNKAKETDDNPQKLSFFDKLVRSEMVESSKQQLQTAESATKQINSDLQNFQDVVVKHGTQEDVLYHIMERLTERVRLAWLNLESAIQANAQHAKEKGKLRINIQQPKETLQERKQKHVNIMEEWREQWGSVTDNFEMDVSSFENTKAKLLSLLQLGLDGIEIGNTANTEFREANFQPGETEEHLRKLYKVCQRNAYRIICIGLEKGGKSTVVNVLIGYDLVPSKSERCTMVPVYISFASHSSLSVDIEYFSKEEFAENLKFYTKHQLSKDKGLSEKADIPEEEVSEARKELLSNYSSLTKNHQLTGSLEDMRRQFIRLVESSVSSYLVKRVNVKTDKLVTEVPIEVLDLPGYDSIIPSHRDMVKNGILEADAIIIPHGGFEPSVTDPLQDLFREISRLGGYNIFGKTFAIVTKMDCCSTLEEAKTNYYVAKRDLTKYGVQENRIFSGCPALTLLKDKLRQGISLSENESEAFEKLNEAVNRVPFLIDGMETYRQEVYSFMAEELPKVRAKETIELGNKVLELIEGSLARLKMGNKSSMLTSKRNDPSKQWSIFWAPVWDNSKKMAHEWRWNNITNKKHTFFKTVVHEFIQESKESFDQEESKAYNLADHVPYYQARYGYVNIDTIEAQERDRLFTEHTERIRQAAQVIAKSLYGKLIDYHQALLRSVGLDANADASIQLSEIITLEECEAQVEALVMRVAYPAGAAHIQWPQKHANRLPAFEELHRSCPETKERKNSFSHQDANHREGNTESTPVKEKPSSGHTAF